MKEFKIVRLTKKECIDWIVLKHYSKKMPIFWAAYGLLDAYNYIQGICIYGQPSPPIQKHAFKDRNFRLYELSRVVIQTKEKNAASFLVGNSIKMLEKPSAIVSYSDMEFNHCGIIYQATNWIYTGATKSHDHSYIINNERVKPITLRDKYGITNPKEWAKKNNIKTIAPMEKHRYFFINANKKQKKKILTQLKYKIIKEYPKCNQKKYDDGDNILHFFKKITENH